MHSLGYAAPETIRAAELGRKEVEADAAVDMWSVGVVAYELLMGAPAFPRLPRAADVAQAELVCRRIRDQICGRKPLPWEEGAPNRDAMLARLRGLQRTVPPLASAAASPLSCSLATLLLTHRSALLLRLAGLH
jgi:serine/threonine protein kinase